MGQAEDAFEAATKRVLCGLLGGEVLDRDVDGAQSTRDFDLVANGVVAHAVEVTSVQMPSARATRTGFERLRNKDLGLTATWDAYVHEEAPTLPIEKRAPHLLNLLYAAGVSEFDQLDPPTDVSLAAAVDELASLHVVKGSASTSTPYRLHPAGFGSGSLDPLRVTRALEAEAVKSDNRRKLADAPAGSLRHLFIWLHDSHWYVSSLLRDPISTPPAPMLPDEVDVIWAAVGDGSDELTCSALLRADRSGLVEIDPTSGAALPRRCVPGAASGPPDEPPSCALCHGPGAWVAWRVERHDPATGQRREVLAWKATCTVESTHWAMPGRDLSALELLAINGEEPQTDSS